MKKDLFKESKEILNPEQRLIKAIWGDSDEIWLKRENEAREFMSRYIDSHPNDLTDAVITISQMSRWVKDQMEYLRDDYLHQNHDGDKDSEEENDFAYAHMILVLGAIRMILNEFEENEGDCFVHLCDKGCKAVRAIRAKERERKC